MSTSLKLNRPCVKFRIDGVYSALERHWDKQDAFTGESHPFWELVYVDSGRVEIVEDGKTYTVGSGEIICHAPGEFHRIKSYGNTSPHFYVLSFSNEGELPSELGDGVFPLSDELRGEFLTIFRKLHAYHIYNGGLCYPNTGTGAYTAEEADKLGFDGLSRLTVLVNTLSSLTTSKESISNTDGAKEFRRLVKTMTDGVDRNLSLSDIASIHHISTSYITKLFRTYAGVGPMSYYAMLRVARIKSLLSSGERINIVAEKMEFSSSAYLSAFFKTHEGISPSEWRT